MMLQSVFLEAGVHWLAAIFTTISVLMCAPQAWATGRWLRAESAHFIVYGEMSESDLRKETDTLEEFDALLRRLLAPPPQDVTETKLEVYLVPSAAGLKEVMPRIGDTVAGFYYAAPWGVFAVANASRFLGEGGREIVFHEYAHHFMLAHFADLYPSWFTEGFAEFVQTTDFRPREVVVGRASAFRLGALRSGWLDFERVLAPGETERGALEIDRFYAESWLATHYLISEPQRMRAMGAYLGALRDGQDPVSAFQPSFGVPPQEFQQQLRTYFSGHMHAFVYDRIQIPESEIQVTRLPPSADDLLLLNARIFTYTTPEDGEEIYNRAADVARRYPDDEYAKRSLAMAQINRGNGPAAREILEPLSQAAPQDWSLLYMIGLSYFQQGATNNGATWQTDAPLALRYFARAARINPDHYQTLYHYALTYSPQGGPVPDNVLDVLIKAHLLAPQVMPIRFTLARALLYAGLYDDALPLARAIAFTPHGGQRDPRVQGLIDAAINHTPPPPITAEQENPNDAGDTGDQPPP